MLTKANAMWADPRQEMVRPFVIRTRTQSHYQLNFKLTACQSITGRCPNMPGLFTDPHKNLSLLVWPIRLPG
jgi:hypothetical protein